MLVVKIQSRFLGVDDVPFDKYKDKRSRIIGTFFRGGTFLDGVLSADVTVDGSDATDVIAKMTMSSKFASQIRGILINGIAVAGFNIIDIGKLSVVTGIPVIAVMRRTPKRSAMEQALRKLGMAGKIALLTKAGTIHTVGKAKIQFSGARLDYVEKIMDITCTRSHIPEPIRAAHMIASGITLGESRGKA